MSRPNVKAKRLQTSSGAVDVSAASPPSSGQVLTATSSTAATWQTPSGGATSIAILAEEQATGTDGADSIPSGSWQTRTLNTEVYDPNSIVSLSSNQFTLGAGTYIISWRAPIGHSGSDTHVSRLFNVTDATVVRYATPGRINSNIELSTGEAVLTITGSKAFRIEHRLRFGPTSITGGTASNLASPEVYTQVKIEKRS